MYSKCNVSNTKIFHYQKNITNLLTNANSNENAKIPCAIE